LTFLTAKSCEDFAWLGHRGPTTARRFAPGGGEKFISYFLWTFAFLWAKAKASPCGTGNGIPRFARVPRSFCPQKLTSLNS
jgi:hypothetical protein